MMKISSFRILQVVNQRYVPSKTFSLLAAKRAKKKSENRFTSLTIVRVRTRTRLQILKEKAKAKVVSDFAMEIKVKDALLSQA